MDCQPTRRAHASAYYCCIFLGLASLLCAHATTGTAPIAINDTVHESHASPAACMTLLKTLCSAEAAEGIKSCKQCLHKPENHIQIVPVCSKTGSAATFCGFGHTADDRAVDADSKRRGLRTHGRREGAVSIKSSGTDSIMVRSCFAQSHAGEHVCGWYTHRYVVRWHHDFRTS